VLYITKPTQAGYKAPINGSNDNKVYILPFTYDRLRLLVTPLIYVCLGRWLCLKAMIVIEEQILVTINIKSYSHVILPRLLTRSAIPFCRLLDTRTLARVQNTGNGSVGIQTQRLRTF